jgi:stage IV sporulation protein B
MRKIKSYKIFVVILFLSLIFSLLVYFTTPFQYIFSLPSKLIVTNNEYFALKNEKKFGNFTKFKESNFITDEKYNYAKSEIYLFGFIPIKKFETFIYPNIEVYSGGNIMGFSLKTKGIVICELNSVETENGSINLFKNSSFKIGDTITQVNDKEISSIEDLDYMVENSNGEELCIQGYHQNQFISENIAPLIDKDTKSLKLGIWASDNASGVGTLTYIRKDNYRFGALGHPITKNDNIITIKNGGIYNCEILGIEKGTQGKTGEVKGLFLPGDNKQGEIDKNSSFGVYGKIEQNSVLLKNKKTYEIGGRLSAKSGKAKILCALENDDIKEYDIEIIKTNYQKSGNERSLVIKVTDKELLKKTGGIIQGMSGSPIIQNNKIIGAVTHVFVSDPTKGFGIYLDWMINQ